MRCVERDPWVGGGRKDACWKRDRRGQRGFKRRKVEDCCSSYPFLLGEAYLLLIYNIYIYYIFNKSGNNTSRLPLPHCLRYQKMCRLHADSGTFLHPPATLVDNHAEIYRKLKILQRFIVCALMRRWRELIPNMPVFFWRGGTSCNNNGIVPMRS